ncbi:hypothetical protein H5410_030374 [Solanum commersonii]|uniref:Uncharacterized protein n=1 Tax=Solanum commersonii TaxID=4109 RepID=A0A9J5YIH4_SOLCO|nr:hypothetical protein H5410_030374 [Solanum commersonii]
MNKNNREGGKEGSCLHSRSVCGGISAWCNTLNLSISARNLPRNTSFIGSSHGSVSQRDMASDLKHRILQVCEIIIYLSISHLYLLLIGGGISDAAGASCVSATSNKVVKSVDLR